MKINAYKFNPSATSEMIDILGVDANGNQMTPQEWLKRKYVRGCIFGLDELRGQGVYKLMGWCYDFKPYLRKFLVKQHGEWREMYAPNRTAIRNSVYGRIDMIVELFPKLKKY